MSKDEQIIELQREARNTLHLYYAVMAAGILAGLVMGIGKKSLLTRAGYVLIGGAVVGVPATLMTRNRLSNILAKAQKIEASKDEEVNEVEEQKETAERIAEKAMSNFS